VVATRDFNEKVDWIQKQIHDRALIAHLRAGLFTPIVEARDSGRSAS
jgi:hypothetical protein